MELPASILYQLAKDNNLLVADSIIYQPSNKDADTYLVSRNKKLPFEIAGTLQNLDRLYGLKFDFQIKKFKEDYFKEITGIKAIEELNGLKYDKQRTKDDAIKLFYLTEVQADYIKEKNGIDEFNFLSKKSEKLKIKTTQLNDLQLQLNDLYQIIELKTNPILASGNRVYKLKRRKFFGNKDTIAVLKGKEFFIEKEICSLDEIEKKLKTQLEDLLKREVHYEKSQILEELNKFENSFSSSVLNREILDRDRFEYQNLGFGYYKNSPLVYLRVPMDLGKGVCVDLEEKSEKIIFSRFAYRVQINGNDIIKESPAICLAHSNSNSDFNKLWKELKKVPTGSALREWLHKVRDWHITQNYGDQYKVA